MAYLANQMFKKSFIILKNPKSPNYEFPNSYIWSFLNIMIFV